MKIASWNVNSLKVRLPHVIAWLKENPVQILGLQETKLCNEEFPYVALQAIGYHSLFAGQKTYNGVGLLIHESMAVDHKDITRNLPGFDDQQRLIAVTIAQEGRPSMRVVCAYFPNGQSPGCAKFIYKLRWMEALSHWLALEMAAQARLVLLGDFNIAPEDRDVHDPSRWIGQNLVSPDERAAFGQFIQLGFVDVFRQFEQPDKAYTWWDYRRGAFRRNAGLRIDHILLSHPIARDCVRCSIDPTPRAWHQPSDHAPVIAELTSSV